MINSSPAKHTNASAVTLGTFNSDQISVSLSDYHGGLKQSWHSHEDTILTILLKGHVREQVGGSDVLANPLSVGIKPAGLRHYNENGTKFTMQVKLKPDWEYDFVLTGLGFRSMTVIHCRITWLHLRPKNKADAIRCSSYAAAASTALNSKPSFTVGLPTLPLTRNCRYSLDLVFY